MEKVQLTPELMERARTAALDRREFARREWVSSGLLFLALVPAEDDLPETSEAYKNETWGISRSLDALGISPLGITIGPGSYHIGQWTGPITMFTIALAPFVVPAVTEIVVTWLKAHSGRKIRTQIGDVKVEARTAEEAKELLQHAMELSQSIKNNYRDRTDIDSTPAQRQVNPRRVSRTAKAKAAAKKIKSKENQ
jgi:hypothetical protein